MKIPVTLQPLIDARLRELPSLIKLLKVGQVLQARVVEQPRADQLRIQIGQTLLNARSSVSLPPGTHIQLQVVKTKPVPELRVLQQALPPPDRRQLIGRDAMPKQMPPRELRESLPPLRGAPLQSKAGEILRQLNTVLQNSGLRLEDLSPRQIQRTVSQSGLFHEARLIAEAQVTEKPPDSTQDVKVQLLQLLLKLRPELQIKQRLGSPPTDTQSGDQSAPAKQLTDSDPMLLRLTKLVESAVARVQLQQSAALPSDDSARQAWQIDLPLKLPDGSTDDAMLRIEHNAKRDGEQGDSEWAVNLAFQFDTIGTLQVRIALNGDRVATTFWSERPATHQRLESRLPILREALQAQGLEVVHLTGVQGDPPQPLISVPRPDKLFDDHA